MHNQPVADCLKATIPLSYNPDTTVKYVVIEIYNFEQKLMNYSEFTMLKNTGGLNIYWKGIDSDGKTVDEGKYLVKASLISIEDTTCGCYEILFKPGFPE